ncbi:VOC family protein [Novosphingobium sp.]|uniref:VOC family protein n=1 Tax=Novosphingobium sp. TaxID=1874826 RepID=UPI00334180DF
MASDRGAFIWYELMTTDATGAKAFYDAVVGWNIDAGNSGPDASFDYRMIVRGDGGFAGGLLAMAPAMVASGAKPGWLGYVHVPDVDAAAQTMVDAGGAIFMGPQDMDNVGRMAMVADPQGAVIYLMTPTPPADNPDAVSDVYSRTEPQHVRWNELWTSDPDAAVALYTGLLGWTQQGDMDMGPMGKYRFIQHEGTGIGAIGMATPDGPGSHWDYYIGVDDIDRAVAAVTAGGGTLAGPPNAIPGGEFSCHCVDPQGATFGLVGPRV